PLTLKAVLAKSSVAPVASIGPLLLPAVVVKRSVPVCTSTVPVLVNDTLMVATPVVFDRRSVPALENDPPPPQSTSVRAPRRANTEPAGLLRAPPLPTLICPPVQLAVPLFALTSTRPLFSVLLDPLRVIPPCAVVLPPPSMVPPLQVSAPPTVTASVPWSVPAESVRLGSVIPPPVLKSTVAAPITSGPTLVTEPVKF